MLQAASPRLGTRWLAGIAGLAWLSAGCGGEPAATACPDCGTVVIAATGAPASVFPPMVFQTVGRDVSDRIYERLAYLEPGRAPTDTTGYRAGLAVRWERLDSLTWRLQLRPGARWHDGTPLTAHDVAFSFDVFADPEIDALARPSIEGRLQAVAVDDSTVDIRFREPSPEQLYDATYHVRVIPRHIWEDIPREAWATDTTRAHLVGSGPYRLMSWHGAQSLELAAVDTTPAGPAITRLLWRFSADPVASLHLLLSHAGDAIEAVGGPAQVAQVADDTTFRLEAYPSAVHGFLGFQITRPTGRAHPIFGNREVRRALSMAIDRHAVARAVMGPDAAAPPGPMSRLLWIWNDSIAVLPADTAQAVGILDGQGWRLDDAGTTRRQGRRPLRFDVLVPATSRTRRQVAEAMQEMWRRVGVEATITAVDFPVFQERLGEGRFDTYIGAWLDAPSPRSLGDQWTHAGWEVLNYGRYANAVFDSLVTAASREARVDTARVLWREAMDVLNADAPALFLYTPTNVAAFHRRLLGVTVDPYSWLESVAQWTVDPAFTPAVGRPVATPTAE